MIDLFIQFANYIESKGYSIYLVGGSVRDYLLYGDFQDIDVATNMDLKTMQELFTFKEIYAKLSSGKIIYNNHEIDITTLRKEQYLSNLRHPDNIIFIDKIEEDYLRRDFTINALYMDKNLKIYDFCNGQNDLKQKLIRFIGNPITRIKEDPLRILRALRFAYKLNFNIEDKTLIAINNNLSELKKLNYTKIHEELLKFNMKQEQLNAYLKRYYIDEYISLNLNNNRNYIGFKNDLISIYQMQNEELIGLIYNIKSLNDKTYYNELINNNHNMLIKLDSSFQINQFLNSSYRFIAYSANYEDVIKHNELLNEILIINIYAYDKFDKNIYDIIKNKPIIFNYVENNEEFLNQIDIPFILHDDKHIMKNAYYLISNINKNINSKKTLFTKNSNLENLSKKKIKEYQYLNFLNLVKDLYFSKKEK